MACDTQPVVFALEAAQCVCVCVCVCVMTGSDVTRVLSVMSEFGVEESDASA